MDNCNKEITYTATLAYNRVLEYDGASFIRDAVDERIVENLRNKPYDFQGSNGSVNGILDSQPERCRRMT